MRADIPHDKDVVCFWCDATPAPIAVITGAAADERGEATHATYKWACAACAGKSLIDLLRIARKRMAVPPRT